MKSGNQKDPRVLWTIVGICFGIVVLTWLPLALQKVASLFTALQEESKATQNKTQELWTQERTVWQSATTTANSHDYLEEVAAHMKEALLTASSSSSTVNNHQ